MIENIRLYDEFRDYIMKNMGVKVVRIKNEEIMDNIKAVINKIKNI